ncbi:MAG TPA: HNH endonuclease [Allosphingosinicella sp.]|jgi:5-methylcytosine-specific restriction endonuclease McrA
MARKKRPPNWFLPGWVHKCLSRRRKRDRLREIWGDDCWWCDRPMRFDGPPNCGKAATIEHLRPKAKGGTWALDNLRLCHVGCNRHLGDRSREEKERMRTAMRPRPAEPRPRTPDPGGRATA